MIDPENLSMPKLSTDNRGDTPELAIGQAGVEPAGKVYETHTHVRAQLFHIFSGSLRLETEQGCFVVPPERAIWVPSNVPHAVTYLQPTALRYLFFRPDAVNDLPEETAVITATPLLRELIQAFLGIPRSEAGSAPAERIIHVLLDQLRSSPAIPLYLPMPRSPRLLDVARQLRDDPGREMPVAVTAKQAAMSPRTFQRHFQDETGMTFRSWLRQAKLMKAVEWLATGQPVGDIAHSLGYSGPSAFIATFHEAFGTSPSRYFVG
ncbi:helix-turn-helix transcriptional regulator [Nitratireductor sp. ZSWI3]|uniref:AraC family transcriptional regulator n=1 Tax=Nitratireductor sp. ZSWI3 TaxID=2966359 RepID=UPI00214FAF5C|nr:helix-turn-helix transcriptional regulator [Nitratireductor sp. ZSWI3]MCR4267709.1 helix-turn-helix transcriptional regulator [Nitratireductor sp. ZSWI3]